MKGDCNRIVSSLLCNPKILCLCVGIFALSAAADAHAQGLKPIAPDKPFLSSVKTIAMPEIDDPIQFSVINPMGGLLPLFGGLGGGLAAGTDAERRKQVQQEFTALLQKYEIGMGRELTDRLAGGLRVAGINVKILTGARKNKGVPIQDLSSLQILPGSEALLDVFFNNATYMAVGNLQDFEPMMVVVARVYRVADRMLLYQQAFQYSKPMDASKIFFHPIITEYSKQISFPNYKAIYESPERAILGFRQGVTPIASRLQTEMLSWR